MYTILTEVNERWAVSAMNLPYLLDCQLESRTLDGYEAHAIVDGCKSESGLVSGPIYHQSVELTEKTESTPIMLYIAPSQQHSNSRAVIRLLRPRDLNYGRPNFFSRDLCIVSISSWTSTFRGLVWECHLSRSLDMYDWDLPSPDLTLQEREVIGSKLQNERIAANVRSTTLATTVRKRDKANFASLRDHLQIHHASSVHAVQNSTGDVFPYIYFKPYMRQEQIITR